MDSAPPMHHREKLPAQPAPQEPLRVLDLYSGIGGMHHALLRLAARRQSQGTRDNGATLGDSAGEADGLARIMKLQVTAVDINTVANRLYEADFGVRPRTLDLQRVTAAQLDELAADLWLLTPPCQPYTTTRNARRRDTADPRAASLLHLLSDAVLPAMRHPPSRLLLENVPGFVGSESHGTLLRTLVAAGYEMQEFIVSPHQLGMPYSRPRYFALAVRVPLRFPMQYDCSRGPIEHPPAVRTPTAGPATCFSQVPGTEQAQGADPDARIVDRPGLDPAAAVTALGPVQSGTLNWPGVYDAGPAKGTPDATAGKGAAGAPSPHCPRPSTLGPFLESTAPEQSRAGHAPSGRRSCTDRSGGGDRNSGGMDPWVAYGLSATQLARFWRVLDVVTPSSTYCNCFTKHYADNLFGAGSVLASEDFAARFCVRDARGRLHFAASPPLEPSAVPQPSSPLPQPLTTASPADKDDDDDDGGDDDDDDTTAALAGDGAPAADAGATPACAEPSCAEYVPLVWRARPRGQARGPGRRGAMGQAGGDIVAGPGFQRKACHAACDRGLEHDGTQPAAAIAPLQQPIGLQREPGSHDPAACRPEQQEPPHDPEAAEAVVLGLRFFTPAEVAAIHGLPAGWTEVAAAAGVQSRQQYGLLGNGLSTDVAAHLLQYLFEAK